MPLGEAAFGEALSRMSTTAWPVLAEISHPGLSETLYLTTNPDGLTSNGQVYTFFPFNVVLPGDTDTLPRAKVTFQNVDRTIGETILDLIDPPLITFKVVTSLDFDTVEFEAANLLLVKITGDALQISGELIVRRFDSEPWPRTRADKALLPALWR